MPPSTWLDDWCVWLCGVLALALILGVALFTGAIAKTSLARRHPAPGRLVDVGGRFMHLNCARQGHPTVILEAGLNDFSVIWTAVQREVATFARVCSYDRAGFGWSEPSPQPRTGTTMAHELHTLLVTADVKPPYVLVGHSFGGALVRLYAHEYPNEVVGMVLVDAAHEDLFARIPSWRKAVQGSIRQFRSLALVSAWGLAALSPKRIPNRGFPDDAIDQYRAVVATTGFFDAAVAESAAFEGSLSELRAARASQSSNLPLIVISRGRWGPPVAGLSEAENQRAWQMWQILQAELVGLSSQSTHVVADQSDHDIPLEQPHLVAEAIRQVVHDTHR